jgi:hypothetical protein
MFTERIAHSTGLKQCLAAAGVAMAIVAITPQPSAATEGPWCVHTKDGPTNCSIPTFEMCTFVALPENGRCWRNPNYQPAASVVPRKAHGRTHRND